MSKSIKTSSMRFADPSHPAHPKQPLGIRQPGGAMPKRQAAGVDLAARRLIAHKDGFTLGGLCGINNTARRGYENVFDTILDRSRLYCLSCGSLVKDENASECTVCLLSFSEQAKVISVLNADNSKHLETVFVAPLSTDKFGISCKTCCLPFYLKEKVSSFERETMQYTDGERTEVCTCFAERRKALALEKRHKRQADRAERKTAKRKIEFEFAGNELIRLNELYKNASSRSRKKELSLRIRNIKRALKI